MIPRLLSVAWWLAVSLILSTSSAEAADLVLRYVTDDGSPIRGELIAFVPTARTREWMEYTRQRELRVPLDEDGRAVFEGVPTGTYWTDLVSPRDPKLMRFRANPLLPTPTITLDDPEQRLELELEVTRGVHVRVDLDLPGGDSAVGFRTAFRHVETGQMAEYRFRADANHLELILPPEAWAARVVPLPGHLLLGVDVDGASNPDDEPILDLRDDRRPRQMVFHYLDPVRVEGGVTRVGGGIPAVKIRAELVEAGDWITAARARGTNIPNVVEASVDSLTQRYEMALPHGRWLIRPVSPRLIRSEPPSVEQALAPQTGSAIDFVVELDEAGDGGEFLVVEVVGPRGRLPRHTPIYGQVAPAGGGAPVWTGTGRAGRLYADGLPSGRFDVTVATLDTLEATVRADAGRDRGDRVPRVELLAGAGFRLHATDEAGKEVVGLGIRVERLDELPELRLTAPDCLEAKRRRALLSDHSGRAEASGFYAGRYRLRGFTDRPSFIEMRLGEGRWQRVHEIDLAAEQTVEIEARLRPAARLVGRIGCLDPPWSMPGRVAVRVFGSDFDEPELEFESRVLGGSDRDRLEIGPVAAGTVRVAVQPLGFDRWSYVGGGDTALQALGVLVMPAAEESARTVDLPPLDVECGPAVDLLPAVADGLDFPSLDDVATTVRVLDPATGKPSDTVPTLHLDGERFEVRGLPAERWTLEITLDHPHFLPERTLVWEIPIELEGGSYDEIVPEIEALGGAIEVRYPAGMQTPSAVRAIRVHAKSRPIGATVQGGRALLPSLTPGRWRLDTGRDEPTVLVEMVEVERGRTTVVRPAG
ncbi:MAG: hypothetical protein AAGE94_15945 [Acidobacteriota bacterium]